MRTRKLISVIQHHLPRAANTYRSECCWVSTQSHVRDEHANDVQDALSHPRRHIARPRACTGSVGHPSATLSTAANVHVTRQINTAVGIVGEVVLRPQYFQQRFHGYGVPGLGWIVTRVRHQRGENGEVRARICSRNPKHAHVTA